MMDEIQADAVYGLVAKGISDLGGDGPAVYQPKLPPKGTKKMTISKLVADFARFAEENRDAKTVLDLLVEVDAQRDEDNWTPAELDSVEDELIILPIQAQIGQLTV
jgi:hypothetical protein